jgi:YbgC/YbaW family acyl-CoA thioester hydrolase
MMRRVQFHETDAAGIVHFSRYFLYMEEAEHALWRAAGLSIASHALGVGWPRVSATFDYRSPLHFEEEFEVHIAVVAHTARSMHYACTIRRGDIVIATGRLIIACVGSFAGEMKAVPLPADIVAALPPIVPAS